MTSQDVGEVEDTEEELAEGELDKDLVSRDGLTRLAVGVAVTSLRARLPDAATGVYVRCGTKPPPNYNPLPSVAAAALIAAVVACYYRAVV